jgi:hypothetical protein
MDARKLPRYTEYADTHPPSIPEAGRYSSRPNGTPNGTHSARGSKHTSPRDAHNLTSPSTNSSGMPGSGSTNATSNAEIRGNAGIAGPPVQPGVRQRIGERGREGTVRFLLNPDREREERAIRAEYGDENG